MNVYELLQPVNRISQVILCLFFFCSLSFVFNQTNDDSEQLMNLLLFHCRHLDLATTMIVDIVNIVTMRVMEMGKKVTPICGGPV